MAEKYNICIDANATWIRQFTWLDAFNNPIDLTNYTVNSQIRVIYFSYGVGYIRVYNYRPTSKWHIYPYPCS